MKYAKLSRCLLEEARERLDAAVVSPPATASGQPLAGRASKKIQGGPVETQRGRVIDSFFIHHRAGCAEAEVLGRRGFALECIAAQVCLKACGRARFDAGLRHPEPARSRRRSTSGSHRQRATVVRWSPSHFGHHDGFPVASGRDSCRSWWRSQETAQFLRAFAKHRAQEASSVMRRRVQSAWLTRWANLLTFNAAKAFAWSLLDKRPPLGAGGDAPCDFGDLDSSVDITYPWREHAQQK